MPERNIFAFNHDTASHGGYVYTAVERWSSRVATARQTDEIISLLEGNFPRSVRIADVGCGDGTFTIEIASDRGGHALRLARSRPLAPALFAQRGQRRDLPDEFRPQR